MNNLNNKLHTHQVTILSKLANATQLRFNDLLIKGLASEHMNYHLKQLLDVDLVEKNEKGYQLTNSGKNYTNLMDDDIKLVERQPKTSVLLHVVRKNSEGEIEHLLNRRLRQPYFGKIGRVTGKVQYGETLEQAAQRELYEETGLKANSLILEMVYHKLRHTPEGECVQDNIFYKFFVTDLHGEFITKTQHQENLWLTTKQAMDSNKYDLFDDLKLTAKIKAQPLSFVEQMGSSEGY